MIKKITFLLLLLPVLAFASVSSFKLKNGLQVIVKTDTRAPVVLSTLWYKVGGSYEHNGITGLSHLLEHMMFQGTKAVPAGDFAKQVNNVGGQFNAMTTADFTQYHEFVSKQYLSLVFKLEADRMHNLIIDQKRYKREINVVKEERHMRTDDNPFALTFERFMAMSFDNSPYQHPVVGWPSDLNHMSVANAKSWYEKWYAPNNAILIVVGDVKPKKVFDLAKKYFGSVPSHMHPKIKPRVQVASLGFKKLTVTLPGKTSMVMLAYNVPSLVTLPKNKKDQAYALSVAANVLAGGASSRLQQILVRKMQVATAVSCSYDMLSLYSDKFLCYGIPKSGISLKTLTQALLKNINKLKTDKVSQAELNRIKVGVVSSKVYSLDSLNSQAMDLGQYAVIGLPYQMADQYTSKIQAVTPLQVEAVAKQYFTKNNLAVAWLTPVSEKKK